MNSTRADEVSIQALSPRSSVRSGSVGTGFSPSTSLASWACAWDVSTVGRTNRSGNTRQQSLNRFLFIASLAFRRTGGKKELPQSKVARRRYSNRRGAVRQYWTGLERQP